MLFEPLDPQIIRILFDIFEQSHSRFCQRLQGVLDHPGKGTPVHQNKSYNSGSDQRSHFPRPSTFLHLPAQVSHVAQSTKSTDGLTQHHCTCGLRCHSRVEFCENLHEPFFKSTVTFKELQQFVVAFRLTRLPENSHG
ncbi:hypothetical protein [Chryseobacterium sp. CFBP8996]|uniref:hypothetical protein n=1 Tax=Chryseobacterium sp. CFBP8996 TaxID=3096529 RepID=UPI002A699BBC|nr:hypothetical protein [Chryseobacterium sp. CFBP8996]MDY0930701.1 hypothetical protein [Chryseobacterium sp. CFBP8996]